MYVCGPTVYSKAHVGHAMSALVFDIIRRYLEYRGYQVLHAMNFTDVDDKIIQRANQQGVDPFELAERYIQEYQQNLDGSEHPARHHQPARHPGNRPDHPHDQALIENGVGLRGGWRCLLPRAQDEDYGKLSGRKLEDMQAGARIEVDERKEHPMDFALWKAAKPGEPAWDSPWGPGAPAGTSNARP